MKHPFLNRLEYTDDDIRNISSVRGYTTEQDFYRHKARVLKSVLLGERCNDLDAWAERCREISKVKFSTVKQIYWIIRIFFSRD